MKKKGNIVFVGIFIIIILVLFGMISMFAYQAHTEFKTELLDDLEMNESKTVINDVTNRFPSTFDGLIMIILIGIWIGGLGSALVKEEHPVMFGLMMFLVIFVLIAGALLANAYEEVFSDEDLNTMPDSFPATHWILTHILEVGVFMLLSILLVIYAKNRA